MLLKEYILTYEEDGQIVANLFDYYDKYVKLLDKRFEKYSYRNGLVLCFFRDHNDINPSMGWISSKKYKNVKVCHCFGCGKTYDIVRAHQVLRQQYDGISLTEQEACYEIADLFNINLEDFDEVSEDEDLEISYLRGLRLVDKLSKHYTVREFSEVLLNQRKSGKVDLGVVNDECVKMIATEKKLYI